ncbi:MAG: type III secretion system chaperone [Chthoniobacterales bacterium]
MDELLQDQAEALVESLGRFLNLADLVFDDEDDTCLVRFDEKNQVTLTWLEEGNIILIDEFITTLSLQDRENRKELVEAMLQANIFWMETQGATLSMHRESGTVIVARQLPVYRRDGVMIEAAVRGTAIRNLVSVASKWRSLLVTGETNAFLKQRVETVEDHSEQPFHPQSSNADIANHSEALV